jgi:Na+-translocating ferredoxin:NAD+ oxidoreductase RNF subunit RnfB
MDLTLILKAALALAGLGLLAAAVLSTASRRFYVETDPRIDAILSALPGSNCGACGNPSCFAAAEEMVAGVLPPTACVAGGQSGADAVSDVLGVAACAVARVVSVRHCGGGNAASRTFAYSGIRSCSGLDRLAGGDLACAWGCLGLGDCQRACPFEAISMDERGLPVVDAAVCTGCGVCVQECPRGRLSLLETVPADPPVIVRCAAHDKVKPRRDGCPACCIVCRKCEKECPPGAITMDALLAVVDYEKCDGCGRCVEVCPQGCIDLAARGDGSARMRLGSLDA